MRKDNGNSTLLLRNLLAVVIDSDFGAKPKMVTVLYEALKNKHIQVFLHNNQSQEAIGNLSWDGRIVQTHCKIINCNDGFSGVVESNLGGNSANLFIVRSAVVEVVVKESVTTKKIVLNLENTAPKNIQNMSYKVYVRAIGEESAEFQMATLKRGNSQLNAPVDIEKISGRVEAGLYVELVAGEKISITFNSSERNYLDFTNNGQYNFTYRKQPGTESDPIFVKLIFPRKVAQSKRNNSLTGRADVVYNTVLTRDSVSRIYW